MEKVIFFDPAMCEYLEFKNAEEAKEHVSSLIKGEHLDEDMLDDLIIYTASKKLEFKGLHRRDNGTQEEWDKLCEKYIGIQDSTWITTNGSEWAEVKKEYSKEDIVRIKSKVAYIQMKLGKLVGVNPNDNDVMFKLLNVLDKDWKKLEDEDLSNLISGIYAIIKLKGGSDE